MVVQSGHGVSDRFTIRRSADARGVVLKLSGELDISTVGVLDEQLADLGEMTRRHVMIDLEQVGFLDSTGLAGLMRAKRLAEAGNYTLSLTRGSRQVQRLLEVAGLADQFTFETGT
jgi:anti-sigma B factor antagonist